MMRLTSLHINNSGHSIQRGDLVSPPDGRLVYDILCNHIIFNYTEIAPYFPADTVYVGIVREPFSQFISSFIYEAAFSTYLRSITRANPVNPIEKFLFSSFDHHYIHMQPHEVMFNNRMSVDFGFPLGNFWADKSNTSIVDAFIKDVDGRFNLVMITELFDESLILLRRLLGWKTEEIIYLKSNVFTATSKSPSWMSRSSSRTDYPEYFKRAFETYASLDVALYKHFYQKLKDTIASQPPEFQAEVADFKDLQRNVSDLCKRDVSLSLPHLFKQTNHTSEFTLNQEKCDDMKREERFIFSRAFGYMKKKFYSNFGRSVPKIEKRRRKYRNIYLLRKGPG